MYKTAEKSASQRLRLSIFQDLAILTAKETFLFMTTSTTIINIKKVALIFFIITGFFHLSSSIFLANNLFVKPAFLLNKTMDIPFAITGLIYGLSSLRLGLTNPEHEHKILDIILICVIISVLLGLIGINLFLPDLKA